MPPENSWLFRGFTYAYILPQVSKKWLRRPVLARRLLQSGTQQQRSKSMTVLLTSSFVVVVMVDGPSDGKDRSKYPWSSED